MGAIIEARDLGKRFDGVTAVDHTSFAVPEGVIFGFLGPNGAGKTTTIKMLTTVLTPSQRHALAPLLSVRDPAGRLAKSRAHGANALVVPDAGRDPSFDAL